MNPIMIPPHNQAVCTVILSSGHSICIKKEGTEVPPKYAHYAAAKGCTYKGHATVTEQAVNQQDQIIDRIINCFNQLQDKDLKTGYPNIKAVSKIAGFNISDEQLACAWSKFKDENK